VPPFKFISRKLHKVVNFLLGTSFLLLGFSLLYFFLNNEDNARPSKTMLGMLVGAFFLTAVAGVLFSLGAIIENFVRKKTGSSEFLTPDRWGALRKNGKPGLGPDYNFSLGGWLALGLTSVWGLYKVIALILGFKVGGFFAFP
jgi:hypothetical protein